MKTRTDIDALFESIGELHIVGTAVREARPATAQDAAAEVDGELDGAVDLALPEGHDLAVILAEAFALMMFECKGALDYGAGSRRTRLLANRVVDLIGDALGKL